MTQIEPFWTREAIADELEAVAAILRRMRQTPRRLGYPRRASWPEFANSYWTAYKSGVVDDLEDEASRLSVQDALRCDRVFDWLGLLDLGDDATTIAARKVLTARAHRVDWENICYELGYGRTHLYNLRQRALDAIASALRRNDLNVQVVGVDKRHRPEPANVRPENP